MIDIKLIRENPELVKKNIKKKFQDHKLELVDKVLELDKKNRETILEGDSLRANRNKLSEQIGGLMKQGQKEEAEKIKQEVKQINEKGNKKSTKSDNIVEKDKQEDYNLEILKTLKKSQNIATKDFAIKEAETSPPSRYNSGSMILAMENAGKLIEEEELREQIKGAGIGTSATRAEIIKKLEKIKYIEINGKTQIITPTQKGEKIYDIIYGSMPDMLNPKLTASWEKGLDMVAKKEIKPEEFMKKLKTYIHSKFNKLVVKM